MRNLNVLISGASVAGPALAYWLKRYGCTPVVVERAPAPRPGGYAVDFRGAAMYALERMNLLDEVRAKATNMGEITYVGAGGRKVASVSSVAMSGELEILRGDLVEILYERSRYEVEYLFDDSITGIVQDADGARVTFEKAPPRTFDLVIGADGLHSNVRRLASGTRRGSATTSASTPRSTPRPTTLALITPAGSTTCRARSPGCTARRTTP